MANLKIDCLGKYNLVDSARSKAIPVRITYPTVPGTYPVVIFSHGAGNSKDGYRFLVRHWARAGYICLQPSHDDSVDILRLTHNVPDLMALAMQATGDAKFWLSRVQDIEHIMANFAAIATKLPAGVLIDENNVAVTGHSFGAFTTQLLAGAEPYVQPGVLPGKSGPTSFKNSLPKAFAMFSPQGVHTPGLGFPSTSAWANMTRPALIVGGSLDNGLQGQPARWRTEPFKYAPAGDKYLLFVTGADHMTCAGKPLPANATGPDLFSYMARASLSFLDAYLKADSTARQSLINRDLQVESAGIAEQDFR
jgi:predicted dienelactone hydrolase